MNDRDGAFYICPVALRKESVDRNLLPLCKELLNLVALRKESVDRNTTGGNYTTFESVALRKESVDRNFVFALAFGCNSSSLSARRAWIEINATGGYTCKK